MQYRNAKVVVVVSAVQCRTCSAVAMPSTRGDGRISGAQHDARKPIVPDFLQDSIAGATAGGAILTCLLIFQTLLAIDLLHLSPTALSAECVSVCVHCGQA